jgi:phage gp46-like protein
VGRASYTQQLLDKAQAYVEQPLTALTQAKTSPAIGDDSARFAHEGATLDVFIHEAKKSPYFSSRRGFLF